MALNPFKRKAEAEGGVPNWYKDQYQHMLVQRNMLAILTLCALLAAVACVFLVMTVAKNKTVEPYVIQIDERSGMVQMVDPVSRNEYAASELIDRYFVAQYLNARESYNVSVLRYNYNVVRVMSALDVFGTFRSQVAPGNPTSAAAILKNTGQRQVRIRSLAYIQNPPPPYGKAETSPAKIMQARIQLRDVGAGGADITENYIVTITFEYTKLQLNEEERLINPLGFTVTHYQIQQEIA